MTEDYKDLDIKDIITFIRKNLFSGAIGTFLGLAFGLAAFFILEKKYETHSVVIPENLEQKILMQVGGAGFNFGGGVLSSLGFGDMDSNTATIIAVLESRELIYKIIKEEKLLPKLFESSWDKENNQWILDEDEVPPSLWHGHKEFLENYYTVGYDNQESTINVSIRWYKPEQAETIIQNIISKANNILKTKAITKVKNNISYLNNYLKKELRNEMRQLSLENLMLEEKKLMMYLNNSTHHLDVIVPAVAPPVDQFIFPNLLILVLIGASLGGGLGLMVASIFKRKSRKL